MIRLLPLVFAGALLLAPLPTEASHQPLKGTERPLTSGYREGWNIVGAQSWWGSDGHLHVAAAIPQGRTIAGSFRADTRVVLHDNPAEFDWLGIGHDPNRTYVQRGRQRKTCDGTCAWNVPLEVDTAQNDAGEAPDGWRDIKIRPVLYNRDGKKWYISSAFRWNAQNGNDEINKGASCNQRSARAFSWYEGIGYLEAQIECPLRYAMDRSDGNRTIRVRGNDADDEVDTLEVLVDRTHHIPAAGPWREVAESAGRHLGIWTGSEAESWRSVVIPIRDMTDGWHHLSIRVTGSKEINGDHQTVVLEQWFRVDP